MRLLSVLLLAAATVAATASAHHSFAAEFDSSKPIVLHGKITKVEWINPHVYVWIDAADSTSAVTNWKIESAAPNYLQNLGWSKASVKAGDIVTIQGFVSKDEPHFAKMDVVTLPSGARLTVGHPDDRPQR